MKTVKYWMDTIPEIRFPFEHARLLPCEKAANAHWHFAGSSVSLGDTHHGGDYGSVEEWRKLTEYLAKQFGGKVEWKEK